MFDISEFASRYHILADVCVLSILAAAQFDNHLWRTIITFICAHVIPFTIPTDSPLADWRNYYFFLSPIIYVLFKVPYLRRRQPRLGCIFVTGADSGMGQATVIHLCSTRGPGPGGSTYDIVFAGAYDAPAAEKKFNELLAGNKDALKKIIVLPLDVTSEKSVRDAASAAESTMTKISSVGLMAVVNYHGVAFNGPTEYMPISMFMRQHDVNYIGNLRMVQAFMPLIKSACGNIPEGHRARLIFTGTGGGPCSPCPSLLSAYMSSKFAVEAMCQSLRMEMHMLGRPVDCCMINPGFVKPTMLMQDGVALTEKMWKSCRESMGGDDVAKDEYGAMMNHFVKYSAAVPGEHVSKVAQAADDALTANRPRTSYKVGIDSKLAPIAGMLPTGPRELLARHGMFGILSPAGVVSGYKV